MLVVLVISISIGLVHSIMMYKRFKRDYSPGGKPPKAKVAEAPLKDKVGYQIWNIKTNITNWGKETKDKLLDMIQRDPDEEEGQVGGKTDPAPSSVGVKDQYLEEGGFYDEDEFTDYSESVKTGFISESTQPPPGYYPESSSPSTIVKTKRYSDDGDHRRHSRTSRHHHDDRTSRKSRHSKSSSPRQHDRSKRRDRHADEGRVDQGETFSPDEHYASVVV